MRVTTAFNKLLRLPGVLVTAVTFEQVRIIVDVRLKRRRLACPECGWSTRARHNCQPGPSTWRTLDLGAWSVIVRAQLRRLDCPAHGVIVEAVPFARHRARFTRDFERWSPGARPSRTPPRWPAYAGSPGPRSKDIVARVSVDEIDPARLKGLYEIDVDEISWKRHHNCLTVVVNHRTGEVVWTDEGKDTAALDRFFAELGSERAEPLVAISMDMGKAYPASAAEHANQATICWDAFHVVKLAAEALDAVRRQHGNRLREHAGPDTARKFKARVGRC